MSKYSLLFFVLLCTPALFSQGVLEADTIVGAHVGDGSRLINLPNQNLAVSYSGDTLHITEGNYVIIPGLSASNSGSAFANAGADFVNACETSFNLMAGQLQQGTTGEWSIVSGTGGSLINKTLPQALFIGQEGKSYLLKWTVQHGGGSSSFDQLNISIATNTETSLANAGVDLFSIMSQSVTLTANAPEVGSDGRWEIVSGNGGILSGIADPGSEFIGSPGQSYVLRWQHYNACSTSSDEINLTFSESAGGVPSSNGRYFIPDSRFRQYLRIVYPTCMDGDSLIVSSGGKVKKILINNLGVTNLDGMQFMDSVVTFEGNGGFTSIPFLAETLRKFVCNRDLQVLPEFPESLDTIIGANWLMNALPSFPLGLKYLELSGIWNLEFLPDLPDSCQFVRLSQVGGCCPGYLTKRLRIPSLVEKMSINYIALDSFPSLPDQRYNLEELSIQNCDLPEMPSLYLYENLKSLDLNGNALLKLDSIPFALQNLGISSNPLICVKNKPPLVASQLSSYPICPQ